MREMGRGEIEIETGEREGGPDPDPGPGHHLDLEQKVRVHHSVEMKEIVILLGGREGGQMILGDVHEEMIGTEGMTLRNRMKI